MPCPLCKLLIPTSSFFASLSQVSEGQNVLAQLCGKMTLKELQSSVNPSLRSSSGGCLSLTFQSDYSNTERHAGFKAFYTTQGKRTRLCSCQREVDLAVAHSHRFRCDLVFVSYLKITEVLQRTPNRYECSCSQLTFDLFLQMLMSAGRTMWSVLISVIITSEDTAAAVNRVTTSLMINTNAVVRVHTHTHTLPIHSHILVINVF